jgi:phage terminase large subunit
MNIEMPPWSEALFQPKRLKVLFGGRGGSKSWAFAQALLIEAAKGPKRILCTREFQGSIQESVHRLLSDTILRLGLDYFYEIKQHRIDGLNGSQFIFEGLKNNTTKIKSMEAVDYVWCEEAEAITERSWDLLVPTIRKDGSEIWISFNPHDEMDATYQRFVVPYLSAIEKHGVYEDDKIYLQKVGWRDNPWFPDELRKEMEDCKASNYRKYLHIWEGECNADYENSIILPEWFEAALDAHKRLGFAAEGVKCLGFDPADDGGDEKALVLRHGVVVKNVTTWTGGDVTDAIDRAFSYAWDERCTDLVYDGIGIGAAVKMKTRHKDPASALKVTGFIGSEAPIDPDQRYLNDRLNKDVFRNKRAQWWWYLRDRFEDTYQAVEKSVYKDPDTLISIDSGCSELSALKSELCRVQRKRGRANTLIQIESKDDMRKRNIPSPNRADALVYAFANPPPMIVRPGQLQVSTRHIV